MNDFKGYSLFSDIDDVALRTRNRAVVMCNIIEQNTKQQRISQKGAMLVIGYFHSIPEAERLEVHKEFEAQIAQRGYATIPRS